MTIIKLIINFVETYTTTKMGAVILLLGILLMDVLAITDVIHSRILGRWLYVMLIILLPIIGFSVWYFRKAFGIIPVHRMRNI